MPRKFMPLGSMNADGRFWNEEGVSYIEGFLPEGRTYSSVGKISWYSGTKATPITGDLEGGFEWKTSYNTSRTFFADDDKIWEIGVAAALNSGYTATEFGWQFAPFGTTLYITNGVGKIKWIDSAGVAFANITAPTVTGNTFADVRPKFLITFRNQLVGANIELGADYGELVAGTYKHLVWWSSRGDGEMWGTDTDAPDADGSNYIPIFDDSLEITGLAAGEDCVFVFKEHSCYRLDGPDFALSPVSLSIGCIAPRTICKVGSDIYFLSASGIYKIDSKSGSITPITEGTASQMLVGSYDLYTYQIPRSSPSPSSQTLAMNFGDKQISMAVDTENRILCLCFRPQATPLSGEKIWYCYLYNIATEQGSFVKVDMDTLNADVDQLIVIQGRRGSASPNRPLGTIIFVAAKHSTGEIWNGRFTQFGFGSTRPGYVIFPWGMYDPTKRVSVRAIRPIFDAGASSGTTDITITGTCISFPGSGYNDANTGVSHTATALGNDLNLTFDDVPFADKHKISLKIVSTASKVVIYNFIGIEVEYEEEMLHA